jgi:hypothetical protein
MSTVLVILQNQWFKDPVRVRAIYGKYIAEKDWHSVEYLNGAYLYRGCKTGEKIKRAFGESSLDWNYWEATPQIAGKSDGVFPPDPDWIAIGIRHFKPDIVIPFGQVAKKGLETAVKMVLSPDEDTFSVLYAPHPAARYPSVEWDLQAVARRLERLKRRHDKAAS